MLRLPKKNRLTVALATAGLLLVTSQAQAGSFLFRVPVPGLKPPVELDISPASYAFGNVPVGQSPSVNFTVFNSGGAAATGLQYTTGAGYSVSGSCGATLAPGAQCVEVVTFTPAADQAYSAFFSVSNGAQSAAAPLTGTGLQTSDSVSVGSLAFPNQTVGTTSAAQGVQLNNTGNTVLAISQISTTGNYAATQNCGASLAVGGNCNINVTFTPQTVNSNPGTLSIVTASGTQSVTLSGTGLEALLGVSPTSLAFGNVAVGKSSTSQSFTLTNNGNLPATSLSIAAPGSYAQTNNCGTALAAGANCTVSVTFNPTSAAPVNSNVTISSSAPSVTEPVSGTGVTPTFTLTPASMNFGAVTVNTPSGAQTYTLQNTSSVPLTIGATTLPSGASLASDNCSNRTLAAGSSCTGSIQITPSSPTAYSGTVSIATNGSSTSTITLSGYGAANDALLAPANTVYTGQQNAAWVSTGYGWVWNTSGYATSAAVGDVHFETLVTNNTGAPEAIYLNAAIDNVADGFKISGVSQSLGCLATTGFGGVCTVGPYTIPPGTTRIDISAYNAGSSPNPAGISAWITNSSGTVLSSTSNTSQFFWTTAGF